jgi:methionyl-tRNA formyltransferase
MKEVGADLLVRTLRDINNGMLKAIPQPEATADLKHAPKINIETCHIDWTRGADAVYNLIRGLSPYPAAFTELEGKKLKLFAAEKELRQLADLPGTFTTDKKTFLKFACADGYIAVTELQLEGKKRLPVQDFLRGYRFAE